MAATADVSSKLVICIIDNDQSIRRSLVRLLHEMGYSAVTFASPQGFCMHTTQSCSHYSCRSRSKRHANCRDSKSIDTNDTTGKVVERSLTERTGACATSR